jgi:hypothetical protein
VESDPPHPVKTYSLDSNDREGIRKRIEEMLYEIPRKLEENDWDAYEHAAWEEESQPLSLKPWDAKRYNIHTKR